MENLRWKEIHGDEGFEMEREKGEGNYSAKQRRKMESRANVRIRAKSCVLMQLCGIGYFGAFFFFFFLFAAGWTCSLYELVWTCSLVEAGMSFLKGGK